MDKKKVLGILGIGVMTLFLNSQAFAWGSSANKGSSSDMGTTQSDQGRSSANMGRQQSPDMGTTNRGSSTDQKMPGTSSDQMNRQERSSERPSGSSY